MRKQRGCCVCRATHPADGAGTWAQPPWGQGSWHAHLLYPSQPSPSDHCLQEVLSNTNSLNYLNQYLPTHPEIIPRDVALCVRPGGGKKGMRTWSLKSPGPQHPPALLASSRSPPSDHTLPHSENATIWSRTGLTDWPNPLHFIDVPIYKSRSKSVPSFMNSPLVLSRRKSSYTTGDQSRSIHSWAHAWKDL